MAKDEAYKKAERKIAEVLKSGTTKLDLSQKYNAKDSEKLTELPDLLWKLTHLTSLDLSNNQLTTLPDSLALAQLTQLTSLDLSHNQLTSLPDSLGQLTQLQWLGISDNKLTTLPDSLGQLTQLQWLDLSYNQLTTLPDSLEQLTQLTSLNLSSNQLTTLPDSLEQLTQLTSLNLSSNQLTTLPDSLEQLTQLTSLDISSNQLAILPESLAKLTQLEQLYIHKNKLAAIPQSLGNLRRLEELSLGGNNLKTLPPTLDQLRNLKHFYLGINFTGGNPISEIPSWVCNFELLETLMLDNCDLTYIPNWFDKFVNLKQLWLGRNHIANLPSSLAQLNHLGKLDVSDNQLNDLPPSLAQLEHLEDLYLNGNPLNPALQSAYDQGLDAVKAYLRSLEQNAEPLYEAKLVLVGEGNVVGKTTLLKALKGKKGKAAPKKDEATTHGVEIDIRALHLPHPTKKKVKIQLNAWDFGGQDVYRVTHQFFFSKRSLYLLVWEPRNNVQQGRVDEWLDMIRLRVGDAARVIIVSTHCKSGGHLARIDKPVFKERYGDMIVDFCEVDSLVPDETTGEMVGIAALKKVIAEESAKLEQMGMGFNNNWKAARDELLAREEARISYTTFAEVCAKHSLSEIDTSTLAHLMHDLGYIVHYSDDENLRDDVVLKPQWLTKAIGFVLEDRATAEREGILPDGHLTQVWRDHAFDNEPRYDPNVYPFFLRLMEKYDVCYRLTDGKASLVAQHVPQVRPELPWLPEQEPPKDQRRIAMVCSMEEDPPGLVPWMIVRTHDYAYPHNAHSLHWQKGMFLSHGTHGTAMLEKRGREFHIYTQAQWPEHFMNVIHSTLEKLITDNWPGLKDRYRFMVPCPEMVDGQSCKGRFNITGLRKFLTEGDTHVRCQECSKRLSIGELLLGFEERTVDERLQDVQEKLATLDTIQKQLAGLDSRIADYFWATLHAIADEGKNGPRLFTLSSRHVESSLQQLFTHPMELQLWCEAEGCQHPVYDYGIYPIDQTREWVTALAPYANFVLGVLKTVSSIAAPAINVTFGANTTETWGIKDKLDLTKAILDKLPAVKTEHRSAKPGDVLTEPERSGILALHRLLNELDPNQEKLGLHRVATYTGDFRWLCKRHYDAYQPNIPDVIN